MPEQERGASAAGEMHASELQRRGTERREAARARSAPARSVALVVMESGGDWPSFIVRHDVDVVACRDAGGEEAAATHAVRERVARLGSPPSFAVLACNAHEDDEAMDRRVAMTQALLASLRESDHGQLIIHIPGRATPAMRRQLIGLTGALTDSMEGNPTRVSLRFGESDRAIQGRVLPHVARPGLGLASAPAVP